MSAPRGLGRATEKTRREGMADAVVALALVDPTATTLDDYVYRLSKVTGYRLDRPEIDAALRRWRARHLLEQGGSPVAAQAVLDGRRLEVLEGGNTRGRKIGAQTCPDCGKVCADKRGLAGHQRTVHQPATCPDCGFETTAGGLGPHRTGCKGGAA